MVLNVWHDVSAGKNAPEKVNSIVEISKMSDIKYEIDKETGLLMLDRFLFSSIYYPGDYGFIPQTLWEDGDPLDTITLTGRPVQAGVLAEVRPIGVLHMIDDGESDDKVVCVYTGDPRFTEVRDIKDVAPHIIKELKHFFETYKELQGKKTSIPSIGGYEAAIVSIKQGMKQYQDKYGNKE
jgi:inorganic pyrophosphatase